MRLCGVALAGAATWWLAGPSAFAQSGEPVEIPAGQLEKPQDLLQKYPPFTVTPRVPTLEKNGNYPCTDCHDGSSQAVNPNVRVLKDEHGDLELKHGGGRFWCLTCHHATDRDSLQGLKNQPISFNEPHLLCGQCHFQWQRDYFYGAHGKRIGSWQGERVLTPCTGCHNPHAPKILPRKPVALPVLRDGLEPAKSKAHHAPYPWEKAHHDEATGSNAPVHGEGQAP